MRNLLLGVAIGYLFQDFIDEVLGRSTLVKPTGDEKAKDPEPKTETPA